MKKIAIAILLFTSMYANISYSVSHCEARVSNYFIGSEPDGTNAHLWVNYSNGGSASINESNNAFNEILSSIMMSIAADKLVKYRLLKDDADCTAYNSDLIGIYIHK